MQLIFVILLAVALAMDAFAVAITLGMSGLAKKFIQRIQIAFTFGFFQAFFFVLGYFLLAVIGKQLNAVNSYLAAGLLSFLGFKMIYDVFSSNDESCEHEECLNCQKNKCLKTGEYRFLTIKLLLLYGTATSIDAFAAGVSFGLVYKNILFASLSVGLITFLFSFIGAASGFKLKHLIGNKANIVGGVILILLAIKSFI